MEDIRSMDVDVPLKKHQSPQASTKPRAIKEIPSYSVVEISDSSASTCAKTRKRNANAQILASTSVGAHGVHEPHEATSDNMVIRKLGGCYGSPLLTPKIEASMPLAHNVSEVPMLCITDLSETTPHFAIEGKVLNNYGTYKIPGPKFRTFFKADIVDKNSSDTITVVVGSSLFEQYAHKFPIGSFIRLEGVVINRKNQSDGGTSSFSLQVEPKTVVCAAPPFATSLSFYPEIKIRQFLDEASGGNEKATVAFVVVQSENLESKPTSTRGELVVADGPALEDRATLSFVSDRKDDYDELMNDIECGEIVMRVARNIGVFVGRENTLSVMDLTVLVPIYSARIRSQLTEVFQAHVASLGYGKDVVGTLSFVNVNTVLIKPVCYVCKSTKVHKGNSGGYCKQCGKPSRLLEIPKLQAVIEPVNDKVVNVQLMGNVVDRVLHLQKPFRELYSESVLNTREVLASTTRSGIFKVNIAGTVVGFTERNL